MITQIIEFFKTLMFFTVVTFAQINIISWLIAFPISVACSYELNYSDIIHDGISVSKFTRDYFVRNWSYMLKLSMKMSMVAGIVFTVVYYLRQASN